MSPGLLAIVALVVLRCTATAADARSQPVLLTEAAATSVESSARSVPRIGRMFPRRGLRLPASYARDANDGPVARGRLEGSSDGHWVELAPGRRWDCSAVYDSAGQRTVCFGGGTSEGYYDDVWTLSGPGASVRTVLAPAGPRPLPWLGGSAIDDPARRRMIVFGGYFEIGAGAGDVPTRETWALSLDGTPTWTKLQPAGDAPPERAAGSAIYDPAGDRMIVFGGESSDGEDRDDVWALSLAGASRWARLAPAGSPPGPRAGHSAVYDPARRRMLVFGGFSQTTTYDDVWELSLGDSPAWSQVTTSGLGPGPRACHGAVFDPVRDRMLVLAGWTGGEPMYAGDVWALSFSPQPAWTLLEPEGAGPHARSNAFTVYDAAADAVILGCGDYCEIEDGGCNDHTLADVWRLDLAGGPRWTAAIPDTAELPYWEMRAVHDTARDRIVALGLDPAAGSTTGAWSLPADGSHLWSRVSVTGPAPRSGSGFSAAYDPVRDRVIAFGLGGGQPYYNSEVWALSLDEPPGWTRLATNGTPPSARGYLTETYDPVRDRLVFFGGFDGNTSYADVRVLSLGEHPTWTSISPSGTPPGRYGHSAIYDPVRDRLIVFGGNAGSRLLGDVWALSLSGTPTWSQVAADGGPDPLSGACAVYDPARRRMLVIGGSSRSPDGVSRYLNDTWALALSDVPRWTHLAPDGLAPLARFERWAIEDEARDRVIFWSGDALHALWEGNVTDVEHPEEPPAGDHLRLEGANPGRARITVRWATSTPGRARLRVFDAAGRLVRTLADETGGPVAHLATWNGFDDGGHVVPAGVYWIRLSGPRAERSLRAVLLR